MHMGTYKVYNAENHKMNLRHWKGVIRDKYECDELYLFAPKS